MTSAKLLPHHCRCNNVTRCHIYTHPSSEVQEALNNLADALARYDDETGSSSILSFTSRYDSGIFTSITRTALGQPIGKEEL